MHHNCVRTLLDLHPPTHHLPLCLYIWLQPTTTISFRLLNRCNPSGLLTLVTSSSDPVGGCAHLQHLDRQLAERGGGTHGSVRCSTVAVQEFLRNFVHSLLGMQRLRHMLTGLAGAAHDDQQADLQQQLMLPLAPVFVGDDQVDERAQLRANLQQLLTRAVLPPHDQLHVPPHKAVVLLVTAQLRALDEIDALREAARNLQQRNAIKDEEKSWEGSLARFLIICALTYVCLATYMTAAKLEPAWVNAVVPCS
jgi:hypothetical protein